MRKKGFTVIELLVVILIMGLLVLLAVPAFRGVFMKGRLEQAGNEVFAFYQRVNRYATTEGVNYVLEVKADKDSLRCIKEGGAGVVRDAIGLHKGLDLTGAVITFTVQSDGFVIDDDSTRHFSIYDSDTGDSLAFYISPLGVMEVNRK